MAAPVPLFVRTATARLTSAQLLRNDGVRALLEASLGSTESSDEGIPAQASGMGNGVYIALRVLPLCRSADLLSLKAELKALERVALLLTTPPAGMPSEVRASSSVVAEWRG